MPFKHPQIYIFNNLPKSSASLGSGFIQALLLMPISEHRLSFCMLYFMKKIAKLLQNAGGVPEVM